MPTEVIVFPHTHWDREWYRTFQEFRIRLVDLIDRVIALLEDGTYPFFMLDGQAIVLEDYLAIKPENRERLEALVRAKKLQVGPWYILPDEFLVSGESIIRNLQRGIGITVAFGGDRPKVGYLPDMFGHAGQIPQILKGFGCQDAVVWRGVDIEKPSFDWRAPDGTSIPTHYLVDGYHNVILYEPKPLEQRVEETKVFLERFSEGPILFPTGSDHLAPVPEMPETLQAVAERFPDYRFRIAPIEEASITPSVTLEGELRYPSKAYLLQGVLSARMILKQENARCQTLLERYVEPTAALVRLAGGNDAPGLVNEAWKTLLQNHPHDSICGCSVDEVHREMMTRYAAVHQLGNSLLERNLRTLAPGAATPGIMLFNPTSWRRQEWVKVTIDWPEEQDPPAEVILLDEQDQLVPCILEGVMPKESFQSGGDFVPFWQKVKQFTLSFRTPEISPMGHRFLRLEAGKADPLEQTVSVTEQTLENEHLLLTVKDGRLGLLDKASGQSFEDVHAFLDEGDAGDEYNFDPPVEDRVVHSRLVGSAVMRQTPTWGVLRLDYELLLPLSLTADRRARAEETRTLRVTSYLTLRSGDRRVEVRTELDNSVLDHRLRVRFRFGEGNFEILREGHFGVFPTHPATPLPLPVAPLAETPVRTFAQMTFSALEGKEKGLAVAVQGLPEAEVVDDGLQVTLLRCVDWLSRDDLRTRGGGAGPHFPTPEAQCQGYHVFEYALIPYAGPWTDAGVQVEAHRAVEAIACQPIPAEGEESGFEWSFILGDPRLVVSALKCAPQEEGIVLRILNPSSSPVEAEVRAEGMEFFRSNLLEDQGESLGRDQVREHWRPYGLQTFFLKNGDKKE